MINLQNPIIPIQVNPIEIDRAIVDLQSKFNDNLPWLTQGYGRAYKNLDVNSGKTVFFPEVYLGKQGDDFRYTNISPDNDKEGQNFFLVKEEKTEDFQQGQFAYLTYDVAIIFSANLKKINALLLETDYFQQDLVAQVRNVITRIAIGVPYVTEIRNVQYLFEDVFKEFQIDSQTQLEKSVMTHFRVNVTMRLKEECGALPISTGYENTKSLNFDGINDKVVWPDDFGVFAAIDRQQPIFISTWVKISAYHNGTIYAKGNYAATSLGQRFVVLDDGGLFFSLHNSPTNRLVVKTGPLAFPLNIWTYIAVSYTGNSSDTGVTFYVDGIAQSNIVVASPITASLINSFAPVIGDSDISSLPFTDFMTEPRMWTVAQSSAFALAEFGAGKPTEAQDKANAIFLPRFGVGALWNGFFTAMNVRFNDESGLFVESFQTQNLAKSDWQEDVP